MNQFEALCNLASKEHWCWDLGCTTCAQMDFRYAFQELAENKLPESVDWINNLSRINRSSHQLGPLPRNYSDEQKEKILHICLESDISSIAWNCNISDWLGYLGLVLTFMHTGTNSYKLLSSSWALQLRELVSPDSRIHDRLSDVAEHEGRLLNIKDLEECEIDIMHNNRF